MIDVSDDEFGVGYVYKESDGIKPSWPRANGG